MNRTWRNLPATVATALLAVGALAPVPALAKVALHLELRMGSSCMSGYKPTLDRIKVKLLRADGTALETAHDDSGLLTWSLCFDRIPVAGNKLQMINGTTQDRTITVPDLTLVVDRVTSVVSGHAPAARTIDIHYAECYPDRCDKTPPLSTTANSHGRYRRDLSSSSIDIDGSDLLAVTYQNGPGDRFTRNATAPYFEIAKPNRISVACLPRGTTTVRLLDSGGTLRAIRSFTATRACSGSNGSFRRNGHAVNVHTGDRIISDLATDARLVWPTMSVTGTGTQLFGRCIANVRWVVLVSRNATSASYSGTTDSTGYLTLITPAWTYQGGDTLDLVCETPRGDRVRIVRTLPN